MFSHLGLDVSAFPHSGYTQTVVDLDGLLVLMELEWAGCWPGSSRRSLFFSADIYLRT